MENEGKLTLTVFLLFLYEISFFAFYAPSVTPDIILVLVVSTGVLGKKDRGLATGFAGGLLQDIFLGGIPGVFTVVKTIIGAVSEFIGFNFFRKNLFLPIPVFFLLSLLHDILSLLFVRNISSAYLPLIKEIMLPQAVHNTAAGLIVYLLLYKFVFSGEINYG